jgi:hypothetical protein
MGFVLYSLHDLSVIYFFNPQHIGDFKVTYRKKVIKGIPTESGVPLSKCAEFGDNLLLLP